MAVISASVGAGSLVWRALMSYVVVVAADASLSGHRRVHQRLDANKCTYPFKHALVPFTRSSDACRLSIRDENRNKE